MDILDFYSDAQLVNRYMGTPLNTEASHPPFIAKQILDSRYFFLNLAPRAQSALTIACGGWERCAPDYRIERTDFKFFGIEFVARGKGVLILDGVENELLPGSVFAYKPLTAHTIRTSPDDSLVKYFIDFFGRGAQRIIRRGVLGERGVAYLQNSQPINDLYEQMLAAGLKGGVLAPRLCTLLLELLSLRIEENAHGMFRAHGRAQQSFERCRAYLQTHFRILQSVSELAGRVHLDPAYLCRLFYRFVGEGPYEMLIRLKMNEAAAHLIEGRFTVKEVATGVGFSDPSHFSRVFKKHYGIPPGRFQGAHTRR